MTGGRFLALLIAAATGLLAAALAITGGNDAGTGISAPGLAAETGRLQGAGMLADALASISRRELSVLLVGVVAGWVLRWLYSLPWRALPRTIGNRLLGWRTSAAMVGLAAACTVILLFY